MKQLAQFPLWCTAVFALAACGESPTQLADSTPSFAMHAGNPVIGSASGSGHSPCATTAGNFFNCDPTNPDGGLRTFSFNATLHADGSVKGRAQVKNREIDVVGRAPIICVRFTRENLAWLIIDAPHAFGTPVTAMAVQDNGEGSAAGADRMTVLFPAEAPALVCDGNPAGDAFLNWIFDNPMNSYDILHGNVQVRAPAAD